MKPNYVIEKNGKKSVIIRTQNQEKCRLSVLLTILSNGKKLSPLLIFKGVKDEKLEKELSQNQNVKSGKIFITFNINTWCTIEIMKI